MLSLVLICVCISVEQAMVSLKLHLIYVGTTEIRAQIKNLTRTLIFLNHRNTDGILGGYNNLNNYLIFETSF